MSSTIQIKINQEYHDLVPRPSKTDYNSLKNSIKQDGLHLPIILNQDGIILDGHTRYQICRELKIKPNYEIKKFVDSYEEKKFVAIANLSRRHLTLFQKGEILKTWWIEQRDSRRTRAGHNISKTRQGTPYKKTERLNMRVVYMLGCSHNTACALLFLLRKADKQVITRLRNGTLAIATAEREVKLNNGIKYIRKTRFDYGSYPTHRFCLRCKTETIPAKKIQCHVHATLCCPKCGWGV